MAAHVPALICDVNGAPVVEHISTGAMVVRARCDNDPRTETPLTIYPSPKNTTAQIQTTIAMHLEAVKQYHIALLAADAAVTGFAVKL